MGGVLVSWAEVFGILAAKMPQIVCFAGAIYLASRNLDGWGWLVFVGVLLTSTIQTGKVAEINAIAKSEQVKAECQMKERGDD